MFIIAYINPTSTLTYSLCLSLSLSLPLSLSLSYSLSLSLSFSLSLYLSLSRSLSLSPSLQVTGNNVIGPNKRDALRGFCVVVFLVGVSQMLFWTVALFQKLVLSYCNIHCKDLPEPMSIVQRSA